MKPPSFTPDTNKDEIERTVKDWIQSEGFTTTLKDFARPWGGFFYINEEQITTFINHYFSDMADELHEQVAAGRKLTPKILVVAPTVQLSWQYHHRRSEEWFVVGENPVGVMMSNTDEPPATPKIYQTGERISVGLGIRHRLVGLENWGIVAEIWKHEDSKNPSNEEDIVRVQDDFDRK